MSHDAALTVAGAALLLTPAVWALERSAGAEQLAAEAALASVLGLGLVLLGGLALGQRPDRGWALLGVGALTTLGLAGLILLRGGF